MLDLKFKYETKPFIYSLKKYIHTCIYFSHSMRRIICLRARVVQYYTPYKREFQFYKKCLHNIMNGRISMFLYIYIAIYSVYILKFMQYFCTSYTLYIYITYVHTTPVDWDYKYKTFLPFFTLSFHSLLFTYFIFCCCSCFTSM